MGPLKMPQSLAGVNRNKSKKLFADAKTETKNLCCTQRLMEAPKY